MDELRARIVALTKAGVFGPPGTWPYVRDNNGEHPLGLNFASEIEFYRIGLHRSGSTQPHECDYEEIYVAVKTQLKGEKEREFTSNDAMFFNEVYMYQTLLPLIEAEDIGMFPKCFYAEACACNNPARDIVITEDMSHQGYSEAPGLHLDLEHLKIALRNLGKFHGLSYKAKKSSPSFASKVKELKTIKFDEEFDSLLLATVRRGVLPVLQAKTVENRLLQSVERFMEVMKRGRQVLRSLKLPEEPFAVICHGEFHKSNILFSKNNPGTENGVLFLDLQMSLYSDPSTDLSFLLCMNASQETRRNFWDELIAEYWNGVTSVEPEPGFSFDQFLANFERKSVYGYLPTSIFLPMMLAEMDANESIEDFLSHPLPERLGIMEGLGGSAATKALADIVEDLLSRGHISKFLEFYNELQC